MDKKNNTIFLLIIIGVILSLKFFNLTPFAIADSSETKYSEISIPKQGRWLIFPVDTEGFMQPSIWTILKGSGKVFLKIDSKIFIIEWNQNELKTLDNLLFTFEKDKKYYIKFTDSFNNLQTGKIIIIKTGGEK